MEQDSVPNIGATQSAEPGDTDPAAAAALHPAIVVGWAREAGFDRAAITTLEPLELEGEAYRRWLERGDHASMGYLERQVEPRQQPAQIFPGARWALCVALRYAPLDDGLDPTDDLWPQVARYARGRDYHNLMGKRLKKLARRLRQASPGCDTRIYVDTGPVLERALAQRAGLGTVGKNTCFLTREGSYFFLGEVFSDAPLLTAPEVDPAPVPEALRVPRHTADQAKTDTGATLGTFGLPTADLCGGCTACLDACPTGALPEPFRLDSRRCISYWTIEHRGTVPEPMREQLEGWVFGCDICQEVCPWNQGTRRRPVPEATEDDFRLPTHRRPLDLEGLLALDDERYRELFRGSAMQRARREGLQRNAATAMGHRGDPRYVPALARALQEGDDPAVRRHAAWALGRIGGAEAHRALRRAMDSLESDDGDALALEIRAALMALEKGLPPREEPPQD